MKLKLKEKKQYWLTKQKSMRNYRIGLRWHIKWIHYTPRKGGSIIAQLASVIKYSYSIPMTP